MGACKFLDGSLEGSDAYIDKKHLLRVEQKSWGNDLHVRKGVPNKIGNIGIRFRQYEVDKIDYPRHVDKEPNIR